MRHPKHRTTIYVVTRESFSKYDTGISSDNVEYSFTCLDSFRSSERAEEVAEAYRKEAKDKGLGYNLFYDVMASTYYDL